MQRITVARLEYPLLRSEHDWQHGALPDALLPSQAALKWADHVVLFFPLWLGDMPALLKGYLEQVARPGFAFGAGEGAPLRQRALRGRSARVIVTMGMPAALYRQSTASGKWHPPCGPRPAQSRRRAQPGWTPGEDLQRRVGRPGATPAGPRRQGAHRVVAPLAQAASLGCAPRLALHPLAPRRGVPFP